MKLDFFNVDEFCEGIPQVSSSKIYSKHGFHPEGLFSEKIFGPVKTTWCGCKTYWGRSRIGDKCGTCDVDITYSNERRKRFAKIVLPFPILNPIMYQLIIRAGKTKMRDMIENLFFNEKIYAYYFDEELASYVLVERIFKERESDEEELPTLPDDKPVFIGVDGVYDLVKFECDRKKDKDAMWKIVETHLSKFYMSNIIILPPEFRPVSKTKDAQMRDEMNRYLTTILNFSILMKDDHLETAAVAGIREATFRNLQRHVTSLYDFIFKKLSKKTGLIRGSILGKRVDFSGRAVIAPEPSLRLNQCSIPYVLALELYKLELANKLLEKRTFKRYDSAIDHIDSCIKIKDLSLLDVVKNCCEGTSVILNRQPTLHRMGILSFDVLINTDNVIKIHPMVCEPYNADFDGDQMAIYRPLTEETTAECKEKLSIKNNLICPTTGSLILGVNQDIILGLYLLTKEDESKKVIADGIDTYEGRVEFNSILPDYPFINEVIDKKLLRVLLDDLARTRNSDQVCDILDDIKVLGFKSTSRFGCTMSLKNMLLKGADTIVSDIMDDPELEWGDKFSKIQSTEIQEKVREAFPYSLFIDSGSRGSWDQANQIVLCRGFVSNFAGKIIETPIKSNLIGGLTRDDFFISCYGSRKGLLDTALNTGDSGYLTRKLVYCSVNLELGKNEDCGTVDTLAINIPEKENGGLKLAKSLIGRYSVTDDGLVEITYGNYHSFLGQLVHVRSPLFCEDHGVCQTCYGSSHKYLHSKYIGIIAAQAMGEVSTQLVLRTFHTSGAAKKSTGDASQQQDIVNDLSRVKKVFHASEKNSYYDSLMKLFGVYSAYKLVLLVHYECIVSQMMRNGKMRWRVNPERDITDYEMVSIESIPSRESWLLALAFSKPKSYLIDGIISGDGESSGILEKIMTNDKPVAEIEC